MDFWTALEPWISAATGQPFAIRQRHPVGEGCIHQSWRVCDRDRAYCVKCNEATHLPMFEADGRRAGGTGGDRHRAGARTDRPWEAFPLAAGYPQRRTLYNLYHGLNHLNLFGGGYRAQAERMISQLLAELKG